MARSPRAPQPAKLAAWRAFLEAHAAITDRLAVDLERERDLQLGWYDVLLALSEAGDPGLRMHELARAVLLSRSGLTRLVDRMVHAGLVDRCPDAVDRRGTVVQLTAAGRGTFRRAAPVHLRGIEAYFASYVTEDEARLLARLFARMTPNAGV